MEEKKKQNQTFSVVIGPDCQEYKLSCKIISLWEKTDIIRTVYENMQGNEPIELDQNKTNKELMDLMVKYLTMHNYKPPKLMTPIKSNKLEDHMNSLDCKFIKVCFSNVNYNGQKDFKILGDARLSKLCDFAQYMQMRPLFKLCCGAIAIEMFCGKRFEKYFELKKKLGVEKMFEATDYYQLKEIHEWIEN